MKAVILSCGKGDRLKHLGYKPTLPFMGNSVLGYIMAVLEKAGLKKVIAFTRPESEDVNSILRSYDVQLFHRHTPSAFATFREFASIADRNEYYMILNSDVVFDKYDFNRFVEICSRLENSNEFKSFVIWISDLKGVGVSIDAASPKAPAGLNRVISIQSESPYSFADLIFIHGSLCVKSLDNIFKQEEKVIFFLRDILRLGADAYAFRGKAFDIDTEKDYIRAKEYFKV